MQTWSNQQTWVWINTEVSEFHVTGISVSSCLNQAALSPERPPTQ